jgi:hypothetical protein
MEDKKMSSNPAKTLLLIPTALISIFSTQVFAQNGDASLKEIADLKVEDRVEALPLSRFDSETRAALLRFTPQKDQKTTVKNYELRLSDDGLIDYVRINREGSSEVYYLDWLAESKDPNKLFEIKNLPVVKDAKTDKELSWDIDHQFAISNSNKPVTYSSAEVLQVISGEKAGPFLGRAYGEKPSPTPKEMSEPNKRFIKSAGFFGSKAVAAAPKSGSPLAKLSELKFKNQIEVQGLQRFDSDTKAGLYRFIPEEGQKSSVTAMDIRTDDDGMVDYVRIVRGDKTETYAVMGSRIIDAAKNKELAWDLEHQFKIRDSSAKTTSAEEAYKIFTGEMKTPYGASATTTSKQVAGMNVKFFLGQNLFSALSAAKIIEKTDNLNKDKECK